MATATKIVITPEVRGNFHLGHDAETAKRASELLQYDMDNFHVLFNGPRHNHIVHQILTAYALGASAEELQGAFDRNAWYQKPRFPVSESDVEAMQDKKRFSTFLDKHEHYSNFLVFFQREIESKGVEAVLVEHLFANDDHANHMLTRSFASLIHPIIHLGYAFEFQQPAIVAQALAQAAVHEVDHCWLDKFLLTAEKKAGGIGKPGKKTLREIIEDMRADEKVREAYLKGSGIEKLKITLPIAFNEIIGHISQCKVSTEQVDQTLLDMYDLMTTSVTTLPNPPESYRVDFILLHIINLQVMFPSFMKHDWLSQHNKLRLIEWQARYDLLTYISQGSPKLNPEDLENYKLRQSSWGEVIHFSVNHKTDDGHLSKMIRALAWCSQCLSPFQASKNCLMKDHLWLKLATLACDSVSETGKESEDRWLYW